MKKTSLMITAIALSFTFGFAFKSLLTTKGTRTMIEGSPKTVRASLLPTHDSPLTTDGALITHDSRLTTDGLLTTHDSRLTMSGRATGIGGIFFKCKDPKLVREWYQTHLGLNTNPYGAVFEWYQGADSTQNGFTLWSPFKETTKYFEPSTKDFMINYRVTNMDALIDQLRNSGVTICDTIETVEYGKFVHILDVEGNKLELWEPNDVVYERMGIEMGLQTTK